MPFLTAVQLWVGIGTFTQSARSGGVTAEMLANASIAREDWLTFAAPTVRESITSGHYFIGVTTIALAVFAFILGTGRFRYVSATCAWVTFFLLVVTALPPFWSLSSILPPLRYAFRPSLFAIPATLFVIGLASAGTHRLIQAPRAVTPIAGFFIGAAALLAVGAMLAEVPATARGLLFRIALAAVAGAAFIGLARWNVSFRYGLIVVGIVELYGFAITHRPSTAIEVPTHA
jgi:hypothetical protein